MFAVVVYKIIFYLINVQVHSCRRRVSDNPINLVTGVIRDKVILNQEYFLGNGSFIIIHSRFQSSLYP